MTNTSEFDRDGILVGWYGTVRDAKGHKVRAFIPRRDEDIAEARARVLRLRDPLIFLAATQGYGREPMTA